ncbi:MAG: hypothetical protein WDO74_36870 [Pseudomonadota bacterium]
MQALREHSPGLLVETLVGDFGGRMRDGQQHGRLGPGRVRAQHRSVAAHDAEDPRSAL